MSTEIESKHMEIFTAVNRVILGLLNMLIKM